MAQKRQSFEEDDGRVVADMSDLARPPLLIPRFEGAPEKKKMPMMPPEDQQSSPRYQEQVSLDSEERRALIGGALAAGLLVVGCLAAGFALLILFISHVWG